MKKMDLMQKYTKAIEDFREANRLAAEASLMFSTVFKAPVEDLSEISSLRELYVRLVMDEKFHADGTKNDKQFIFAILHLFSPASLCGGAINKKLRKTIASSIGVKADSAVYRMRSVAVTWYDNYPLFHSECNKTVKVFEEYLGLIDDLN